MAGNNTLTSRQAALFTFVTQTGIGIVILPAVLAQKVGHDGWISIVITGTIAIVLSALIIVLMRRYSDKTIFDITKCLFGKTIGTVVNVLVICYLILASSGGVRIFSAFLKITLLPKTPPLVLSPFVMLPTIYLVWYGLKYVARFKYVTIISYTALIIYIILINKELHPTFLMPVGEAGVMSILSSISATYFAFIGLELIVIFYPEISNKEKLLKWHMAASFVSMLFFIMIVTASTALFGPAFLRTMTIPMFNLSRVYNAPILERVDLYIVTLWYLAMGCSIRAYVFCAYYSLQKVFKLKKSKLIYVLFFALLIILSRIPKDINEAFLFIDIINVAGIVFAFFLISCLFLSFIRKKGVKY